MRRILGCILVSSLFFGLGKEVKGAIILTPSFSFSENYNDNLFFTEKDRESDFTTILTPILDLAFTSKYIMLSIEYRGSAQFHAKHSEADGYFQALSFEIDLPVLNRQVRGLEVSVTENVSYSPDLPAFSFGEDGEDEEDADERFRQVFLDGEGVEQSGRVDTFRNRAGISLRYPFGKNYSVDTSYLNVITRYSGGGRDDSVVHVVGFGGNFTKSSRWLSKNTEWTVGYGSSLSISDVDEDAGWIHRLNLSVQHLLTRLVSVSAGLGVALPEEESPQITSEAAISKRYKTGSVELRYARDVVTGLGVIQRTTRRQSLVGVARRALSQRISSSIRIGYVDNQSFGSREVDISVYTAGTRLSIRLLSWLSGSFDYAYLNQQSRGGFGEDAERNVASFTLTALGPPWRIMK